MNSPLTALPGLPVRDAGSLFSLDADHVCIDAVKPAEDGVGFIVRLHEFGGARGTIRLASEWCEFLWQETDMLENPLPGEGLGGQGSMRCGIGPYEIKTFRIQF